MTIGATVVATEAYLNDYLDYLLSDFAFEWFPILVRILLVSAPFLLLANRRITALQPWLLGITLTAIVWGYVVFKHRSGGLEGETSVSASAWTVGVMLGSSASITLVCAFLSRHYGHKAVPDKGA